MLLPAGVVHVWRVPLDEPIEARVLRPLLSSAERAQADRFHAERHRTRYTVAHGRLRQVMARYTAVPADRIDFDAERNGKPVLIGEAARTGVHFNLSHSADLALIAIAANGPVGVDVEAWDRAVEHLELAEHFFSPAERTMLRALAPDLTAVAAGFFAAWTRKEAYLKATGDGITRGLHHFDVTLDPTEPARLLADRLDIRATDRWEMVALDVGAGYSAALVATAPLRAVTMYDAADLP